MNYITFDSGVPIRMMSLAVVTALAYLAFVFCSESFNPFVKPRIQGFRGRWRYGWRMALTVIVGGIVYVALSVFMDMSPIVAIAISVVIAGIIALCVSIGRIRYVLQH